MLPERTKKKFLGLEYSKLRKYNNSTNDVCTGSASYTSRILRSNIGKSEHACILATLTNQPIMWQKYSPYHRADPRQLMLTVCGARQAGKNISGSADLLGLEHSQQAEHGGGGGAPSGHKFLWMKRLVDDRVQRRMVRLVRLADWMATLTQTTTRYMRGKEQKSIS